MGTGQKRVLRLGISTTIVVVSGRNTEKKNLKLFLLSFNNRESLILKPVKINKDNRRRTSYE